jgi:hypothetical protein
MRRNVALASRVGVRAPGSAHVGGPFDHHKVIDRSRLEADRCPEAGEARADDRDAVIGAHPAWTIAGTSRGSSSNTAASSS